MKKTYRWSLKNCKPGMMTKHKSTLDEGEITAKSIRAAKLLLTKRIKERFPNQSWGQWRTFENPTLYFRKTKDGTLRINFWCKGEN